MDAEPRHGSRNEGGPLVRATRVHRPAPGAVNECRSRKISIALPPCEGENPTPITPRTKFPREEPHGTPQARRPRSGRPGGGFHPPAGRDSERRRCPLAACRKAAGDKFGPIRLGGVAL